MAITLNPLAYLTLEEVKDWLNIKPENTSKDSQLTRHINMACARVEKYIDGPVMNRSVVEDFDGNNSNVIVPSLYPIVEVTELRIDMNRSFDSSTVVDPESYVLRGLPSIQVINDTGKIGIDVALRDEENNAISQQISTGSNIQSIRLSYTAGRGDIDTMPEDLKTATLMLVEWYYILKENREIGVASKGVRGESYSRRQEMPNGLPEEVVAILDQYQDFAFPAMAKPQKNNDKL